MNKIHCAVSGETAAEVIYHRADAEKDFIGLMSFAGEQPALRAMGQLVSGYLISLKGRRNVKYL